ncbi:MAG: polyprenyl synthetase family protein [Armatimonadetes bacterium]|nr:polyprenyl synthetase family protein [Armatimonadota bacterium]
MAEDRLDAILPSPDLEPQRLHLAMRHSALAPGKRIRPALCMAAAEAVGGKADSALDAGCAVELVHCFSLIHDDLPAIDDDDLRRGRETSHVKFGEAMAILAGDALFALAFQVATAIDADDARVRKVIASLAHATGSAGLVGGEVLDIQSEGSEPNSLLLRTIHERKTGALITACCVMGGVLGGGREEDLRRLGEYGREFGLAFQISDDILNETATPEQLGKAVGSDRARGKQTYPALMGLEASRAEAGRWTQEAVSALEGLPGDVAGLLELAHFAADRQS